MKEVFESFEELARQCTKGDNVFHRFHFNKHENDPCYAWQQGVLEFGKMLDKYVEFPEKGVEFKSNCLKDYNTKVRIKLPKITNQKETP